MNSLCSNRIDDMGASFIGAALKLNETLEILE
jgi:hypothetical protein